MSSIARAWRSWTAPSRALPAGAWWSPIPALQMHTADELRAELQRGLVRELSDLNPMKVLEERK